VIRAAASLAALAALALPGCGSEEPEPADLAAAVPPDVQVYVESVLRPEGAQRDALESSLSLLLDTDDPGALITRELNEESAEDDSEITYEGDVEPWLGERGAVFVSDFFPDGDPDGITDDESGALLADVTDQEAAQGFIDKAAAEEEASATDASYEGVDYLLLEDDDSEDDEPSAAGLVGDHVVFGSEDAFQDIVDVKAGAPALADDEAFSATLGESSEAAASLYADVPAIVEAADAAGELSRSHKKAVDFFAGIAEEPVTATVDVVPNGFGLEVSYGAARVPFLGAAEESALLRRLPEDAWFAAGFSDLGDGIAALLRHLGEIGAGEIERLEREFFRETGTRFEESYEGLGDGAFYATGHGIFGAGGGVVVETESPRAATEAVRGLRRGAMLTGARVRPLTGGPPEVEGYSFAVPDAPSTINYIAAGKRVVIAYGEDAAAAVLDPEQTLESNADFKAASAALGEEFDVGFFLDFGPVMELLDLAGAADPSVEEAQRYLEAIDFVITGSASEAGRDRQRIFLGLEEEVSGPAT
jgi:Protein of unknown function (DUF3352)